MRTINVTADHDRNGALVEGPEPNPLQVVWEIEQAVRLCRMRRPQHILEVGSYTGGTLKLWCEAANPAVVVAVDSNPRVEYWPLCPDTVVHVLATDSRDPATVATAALVGPYEWIFIDACHDYDYVRADWQNYGPMVKAGGVVLFHDIDERNGYGVHQLWREIQGQGHVTQEFNAGCQGETHCGIGVVYL